MEENLEDKDRSDLEISVAVDEIAEAEEKTSESDAELLEDSALSEEMPAAFTLVIQSWATPIIGVVMLIAGLFGGYYLRPILIPPPTPVTAVEGNSISNTENVPTVPTPDATRAAQQQGLMTAVVESTRHFYGDPNAPVTIIEFSDFQ